MIDNQLFGCTRISYRWYIDSVWATSTFVIEAWWTLNGSRKKSWHARHYGRSQNNKWLFPNEGSRRSQSISDYEDVGASAKDAAHRFVQNRALVAIKFSIVSQCVTRLRKFHCLSPFSSRMRIDVKTSCQILQMHLSI